MSEQNEMFNRFDLPKGQRKSVKRKKPEQAGDLCSLPSPSEAHTTAPQHPPLTPQTPDRPTTDAGADVGQDSHAPSHCPPQHPLAPTSPAHSDSSDARVGHAAGRRKGALNYTDTDLRCLYTLMINLKPITGEDWDVLAQYFNHWAGINGRPPRTGPSLKDKNRKMAEGSPTGGGCLSERQRLQRTAQAVVYRHAGCHIAGSSESESEDEWDPSVTSPGVPAANYANMTRMLDVIRENERTLPRDDRTFVPRAETSRWSNDCARVLPDAQQQDAPVGQSTTQGEEISGPQVPTSGEIKAPSSSFGAGPQHPSAHSAPQNSISTADAQFESGQAGRHPPSSSTFSSTAIRHTQHTAICKDVTTTEPTPQSPSRLFKKVTASSDEDIHKKPERDKPNKRVTLNDIKAIGKDMASELNKTLQTLLTPPIKVGVTVRFVKSCTPSSPFVLFISEACGQIQAAHLVEALRASDAAVGRTPPWRFQVWQSAVQTIQEFKQQPWPIVEEEEGMEREPTDNVDAKKFYFLVERDDNETL